jgi:hypothetical protein
MTYDPSARTWVKGQKTDLGDMARNKSKGDLSEDDPFQHIPDLSVDELQELMRARGFPSAATKKDEPLDDGHGAHGMSDTKSDEPKSYQPPSESRPQTSEGPALPFDTSSVQSKVTRFTSSGGPKTETRATSWGTDELEVKPVSESAHGDLARYSEEAEHEIRVHDGRTSAAPHQPNDTGRQPRAVTISFSSPLVSHIGYQEDSSFDESDPRLPFSGQAEAIEKELDARNHLDPIVHDGQLPRHSRQKPLVRVPSRRTSFDGHPFIGRPISRIDEQNEDSANQELSMVHRTNASLVVSTPSPNRNERSIFRPPSTGANTSYSFHLSPLADFTVHQIDDPLQLEVSYISQRTHPTSLRQVHGTFALAAEDLIKHITDVEPYEPYWEHVRRLNLCEKGLVTLHRLNDFCSRLEELDVSDNEIGQLSGVPSTIRSLKIQRNCLSNLTAWSHLSNLQYLDISGNELGTLDVFSGLVHLRELRANNNKLRNIDGILDLDGLLSLKVRGNSLTSVDFKGAEL